MRLLVLLLVASVAHADAVWLTSPGEKKIVVIKEVRTATGLGLKEAKDLVEAPMPQLLKTSLSAADAKALVEKLAAAGAVAQVRRDDEKAAASVAKSAPAGVAKEGSFAVRLESFGASKIAVIKVVKDTLGLGLKESKDLVEASPTIVWSGDKAAADALVAKLVAAGATASTVPAVH
jgi:large subunit ribosomal protein L7/L12